MSLVQRQIAETSLNNVASVTLNGVSAGNTIVARVSVFNSIGTAVCTVASTIGGSGANTWTTHQNRQAASASVHIASASNVAAGNTVVTATISGSSGDRYVTLVVEEWSGLSTSSFDVSTGNSGSGTAASTGTTAAKAQNNEVVFCVFGVSGSGLLSTPSGFTNDYLQNDNSNFQPISAASRTVNASGGESASITLTGSDSWAAAIATFRESGGGGGGAKSMPPRKTQAQRIAPLLQF